MANGWGLKRVSQRVDDALARIPPDDFEALVAKYYRQQGYQVEEVGAAVSGRRFDGGIDLKLRRQGEYILVQCKRWNANQVPYNDVVQLGGLITTERATGAIFVTVGEYSRAAKEKGAMIPGLKLIDGKEARSMLSPLLAAVQPSLPPALDAGAWEPVSDGYRNRSRSKKETDLPEALVRLGFGLIFLLVLVKCVPNMIRNSVRQSISQTQVVQPKPVHVPNAQPVIAHSAVEPPASYTPKPSDPPAMQYQQAQMSDAELKEWKRKNKEAMKIIEKTTPEL